MGSAFNICICILYTHIINIHVYIHTEQRKRDRDREKENLLDHISKESLKHKWIFLENWKEKDIRQEAGGSWCSLPNEKLLRAWILRQQGHWSFDPELPDKHDDRGSLFFPSELEKQTLWIQIVSWAISSLSNVLWDKVWGFIIIITRCAVNVALGWASGMTYLLRQMLLTNVLPSSIQGFR